MNDTEAKKTVSLKKLSAYLILFVVLGSGILYTFYRLDKAQKVKQPVRVHQELLGSGIRHAFYRLDKAQKVKQPVQIYQEFLEGERKVGSEDIYDLITPTGEPDRRYSTDYAIVDSNGDGIPELHIMGGPGYIMYSCKDNEMYYLKAFWGSMPWRYVLLNSGAFIYHGDIGYTMGDYYRYFELDDSGNEINKLVFSWSDDNENLMCDEEDQFMFDGESCTKEEWFAKTRQYLFTDEEGKEQIRDRAEWTVYCESIW